MTPKSSIIVALLALIQVSGLIQPAHAQAGEHGKPDRAQKQHRQDERGDERQSQRKNRQDKSSDARRGSEASSDMVQVQIGGYFQQQQREAARAYYGRPENRGFCPPGLAKKWRQGYPLPPSVVVYDVPRSVVLTLGVPPSGYRYVRVASDILLIAIGTSMVIDAIEDLVR